MDSCDETRDQKEMEGNTDRQRDISSYQTHVDSPRRPPAYMATDKRRGNKADIRYEQKEKKTDNTVVFLSGKGC